ncbi:hypothetical protein NEFER03_1825 [Nematocida sp. LUAm3]|nr:hypothetical protein NEFER03_1825 [Nematocida sp. LUAm3]KAI5173868.1 hypothetical protein NEFER02_0335 [Nematocida sp. LUAm2]KAI5177387.1 hypothetical protein NEFER01_0662 [Nematocida sp. LUAm1]
MEGLSSSYILIDDAQHAAIHDAAPQHITAPQHVTVHETAQETAQKVEHIVEREVEHVVEHVAERKTNQEAIGKKRKIMASSIEEERYVTILTPKKEHSKIFLTPVKRTKRTVINGLKTGSIRVYDDSMDVQPKGTPYISLVECFKKLEEIQVRDRRDSIEAIVKRHLSK